MKKMIDLLALPHAIKLDMKLSDAMILAAMQQNLSSNLVHIRDFSIKARDIQLDMNVGMGILSKSFQLSFVIRDIILDNGRFCLELEMHNQILMPLLSTLKKLNIAALPMVEIEGSKVRVDLSQQVEDALATQSPELQDYVRELKISDFAQESHFFRVCIQRDKI
jgi:hypothetical protein